MPVLSKKASKEIANLINRLQVWTRIQVQDENSGNVSKADLARIIIAESEVALLEYGIVLPSVGYSQIVIQDRDRAMKMAESA